MPRRSFLPRHLPSIKIKSIDAREQRYDTAGDYREIPSGWVFSISKQGNIDEEFLILIHELVEWYLTQKHGIPEPEITRFDIEHGSSRDPGSERDSPYREEHEMARKVERVVGHYLGKKT